jgi:hypothetical protein
MRLDVFALTACSEPWLACVARWSSSSLPAPAVISRRGSTGLTAESLSMRRLQGLFHTFPAFGAFWAVFGGLVAGVPDPADSQI